jgi:arginyl-tRNA synthetase
MLAAQTISIISLIKKKIKKAISKNIKYLSTIAINFSNIIIDVEKCRNLHYGDYASNIAMVIGFKTHDKIIKFANVLRDTLIKNRIFSKIEVANQGFINFFVSDKLISKYLKLIIRKKNNYFYFKPKKLFYNIEFVSANPTGMLHIGHARNGVFGDTMINI